MVILVPPLWGPKWLLGVFLGSAGGPFRGFAGHCGCGSHSNRPRCAPNAPLDVHPVMCCQCTVSKDLAGPDRPPKRVEVASSCVKWAESGRSGVKSTQIQPNFTHAPKGTQNPAFAQLQPRSCTFAHRISGQWDYQWKSCTMMLIECNNSKIFDTMPKLVKVGQSCSNVPNVNMCRLQPVSRPGHPTRPSLTTFDDL